MSRPSLRRIRPAFALALVVALGAPATAQDVDNARPAAKAAAKAPVEDTGMLGTNSGEQIYAQICQGCHMPGGKGAEGAGRYPAFAGNQNLASSRYMALTILNGRRNMPAFARPARGEFYFPPTWLTDQQVANVVNYIRTSFGNDYRDPITAAEVQALQPPKKKKD
jgi:mono/diheme cytochrome c family protein